ncbi:MAG: PAS domain-containing protein [Deltaproteobacteria bacterium]|nr:PAS domain-containing protein [Deltaproteobacteria bacterium]
MPTPVTTSAVSTSTEDTLEHGLSRSILKRRLTYIMMVRVALYTLLLGGTVALHLAWGSPDELAGPYVRVLFVFISLIYVISIGYALAIRLGVSLKRLALLQNVVDLATTSALVHVTGGGDSAFLLFYLLSPLAAAVSLDRRAALWTAGSGTLLLAGVSLLGYLGYLPVLPGQLYLPWGISLSTLIRAVLIHAGGMLAMAVLAGYLAEQLRHAADRVEQQQQHIADLAQLNSDIIRCLSSGLFTVATDGRLLVINEAGRELLGLRPGETVKMLTDIGPELDQAVRGGPPVKRAEVTLERNGLTRTFGLSTSALTDHNNDHTGYVVNFQDLTALKQMEQAIKRAEQLATLGRVAAGIAHEIRNPLASISGSLELLRGNESAGGESHRLMSIALREIERLDGLIGELLNYARPQQPKKERIDLGQEIRLLVGQITSLLPAAARERVKLGPEATQLYVEADRDQLMGVLWNLIANATEAGENARVTITCSGFDDEYITLSIADTAGGIAKEHLAHIFEPFYTTKAKGSGLGLAIVQRVIEDHAGEIEVQSTPGVGTTFTVRLKRQPPAGSDGSQSSTA